MNMNQDLRIARKGLKILKTVPKLKTMAIKEAKARRAANKSKKKAVKKIKKYIKKKDIGAAITFAVTGLYGAVAEEQKICVAFIQGPQKYENYYYQWLRGAKGGIAWEAHYDKMASSAEKVIPGLTKNAIAWRHSILELLKLIDVQLLTIRSIAKLNSNNKEGFLVLFKKFLVEMEVQEIFIAKQHELFKHSNRLVGKALAFLKGGLAESKKRKRVFKEEHPLVYIGISVAATMILVTAIFVVSGPFIEIAVGHKLFQCLELAENIEKIAEIVHSGHATHSAMHT